MRFARSKWLGHEMANYYYRTRYPPSPRKETTSLKSRGDCLKVNELESNARGALSPSSRRIETRALDDFRVIEHVHSFSRREDFDDRAVCFDTNDDDAIPHAHSDE